MCSGQQYSDARFQTLKNAVKLALLSTFSRYHKFPGLFHFTNALSFSSSLSLFSDSAVNPHELAELDAAVDSLLCSGITEESLTSFVSDHIFKSAPKDSRGTPPKNPLEDSEIVSVRDLLLEKLQSGEYTSDEKLWPNGIWRIRKQTTAKYYDGAYGDQYAKKYSSVPVVNFTSRLEDMFKPRLLRGLKAIDVGCGPGQYAALLKQQGFEVELVDASRRMLSYASRKLKIRKAPPARDYFDLEDHCKDQSYDLIFASAMMVHVPRSLAPQMYQQFYRMLKPGGILFVNFKIGDHSLVSIGGRYYQYYRDREVPWSMLRAAGFGIVEIIERWNGQTSCGLPREIRWVNFYCVKPTKNSGNAGDS